MRKVFLLIGMLVVSTSSAWASEMMGQKVYFKDLKNGTIVKSPVTVCIGAEGVEVEPASKGVNPGKGHHHILVDVELPKDLGKPIPKDKNHIHMGDGSKCKEVNLGPGNHTLKLLFANGHHFPMRSVHSDSVDITVEE